MGHANFIHRSAVETFEKARLDQLVEKIF